jgi:hypothetical protein
MRRPSEPDDLSALTAAALERGIIDAAQRDRLHALAAELSDEDRALPDATAPASREARGSFSVITVAYTLGVLLVLFALGWFLVDRWSKMGPAGVLVVAGGYAGAFALAGTTLRRRGFPMAGGLIIVLAVMMTPAWTWAVLRLTGFWPDPAAASDALARYEPYLYSRAVILDLATIGVALATLRRIRFFALGAPIAIAFVALSIHLGAALGDPDLAWYVGRYYQLVIACATLAIAYALDRRQPPREDYAVWFYMAGVVMLAAGYIAVWSSIGAWRHALPLVAVSLVAASLYLRRRVLLIGGGLAAFGYLAYLAFDVFRRVVALPVAIAALGLLVIVTAVWVQRRFPALVERVSRQQDARRKALPTGPIAVLGPLAIALTAMLFAMGEARERTADRYWRTAYYARRWRREIQARKVVEARRASAEKPAADSAPMPPRR